MRVYSLRTHSRLSRATMPGGAWPRLSRTSGAEGVVRSSSKASCEVTGTSTWEGGHPGYEAHAPPHHDVAGLGRVVAPGWVRPSELFELGQHLPRADGVRKRDAAGRGLVAPAHERGAPAAAFFREAVEVLANPRAPI